MTIIYFNGKGGMMSVVFYLLIVVVISLSYGKTIFCVQLSSVDDLERAKKIYKKASHLPDVRIERIGKFYVVRSGFFTKRSGAKRVLQRAKRVFKDSFVRECNFIAERIVQPSYKKVRKKFYTYELGMRLALMHIKRKNFRRAEEIYRELLKRHPDSREIKIQLARVLYWQKRYEESLEFYRQVIDFEPDLADEMRKVEIARDLEKVRRLEEKGKIDDAIEILERLYREEKELGYDEGMILGRLYMKKGRYRKAEETYRALLSRYPDSAELKKAYFLAKSRSKVKKKTS
jgi:tetratricopeptide (TPR) repeat protein